MSIQKELISFAFEKAYPYIRELPLINDYLAQISFILVGSAATGLCNADSDVDICLICNQQTFDIISEGTRWVNGRPTEVILDGRQLHYYAVSTDNLNKKIAEMDELALYVYGNAIIIDDATGQYKRIAEMIHDSSLLSRRFDNEKDMLERRRRALHYVMKNNTDPMVRMEIGMEVMSRLLRCIALFDGRDFDSRKRFYQTALLGPTGKALKPKVDAMFLVLGLACRTENVKEANEFLELVDDCFEYIS